MIDLGFSKLLIIGGLALIVVGPERLPHVARTVGTLLGRAQRYISEVKAEVSQAIELEELKKAKQQFDSQVHNMTHSVEASLNETQNTFSSLWHPTDSDATHTDSTLTSLQNSVPHYAPYKSPRKNWRLKRSGMPQWYKQQNGIRTQAQSGAARVARFRPKPRATHRS